MSFLISDKKVIPSKLNNKNSFISLLEHSCITPKEKSYIMQKACHSLEQNNDFFCVMLQRGTKSK